MPKRLLGAAAMILAAACTPSQGTPMSTIPPQPSQPPAAASGIEGAARAFVDDLAGARFDAAEQRFDDRMRGRMPSAKLARLWNGLVAGVGAFQVVDGTRVEGEGALRSVHVTARFAKACQDLKVVFDAQDRIGGLWLGPVTEDLEANARRLVEKLADDDFAGATAGFDATMASALPVAKLSAAWGQITAQAGAFGGVDAVKTTRDAGHWTVLATCRFAQAPLVAKVVFDAKGQIVGLFFVPPEASAAWSAPAYAHPDSFTERAVQVGRAPPLPGTLTRPLGAGPFPVVVLVHGSGPSDADESVGGVKVFKDLAWGLASKGVAVLRYVKRTRQAPAGVATEKEEVIDGARAAVELCRATSELDPKRVVVLGHSQGARLAPRIAAEAPGVAAIVMLAAPSRPLQDIVVDQLTYFAKLDPDNTEAAKKLAEAKALKARLDDPGLKPDDDVPFLGATLKGAYFLAMRGYDAPKAAASLKVPILVLQGDRDYQITALDLDGYKRALGGKPNVTIKQYPALNHLFVAGSGAPSPSEYERPGHVDEQVVADIAAFVTKLPR